MKEKKKSDFELLDRYGCVTADAFGAIRRPGRSAATIRGILSGYCKQGTLGSHPMPKHNGQRFYFLTRKGTRALGVNSKWVRASAFKPRSFYEKMARLRFCTQRLGDNGLEWAPLLKPSEFQAKFPQLADGAPDRYFCVTPSKDLLALHAIGLPDTRRLVTNTSSKFVRYLKHELFRKLIVDGRFKIVLILPSAAKAESVKAELELRLLRLHQQGKEDTQEAAFLKLLSRSLILFSSASLGRLIT